MISLRPLTSKSSLTRLNEYELDGKTVYGCEWTGKNLQAIIDLVGVSNLSGYKKGKLTVYGRLLEVGDFIYTQGTRAQFRAPSSPRNGPAITLPPNAVMVANAGSWNLSE